MSSSRTPKTVTPVPAAAYPTDRKLKAIETAMKKVQEEMGKLRNDIIRTETLHRENQEVCKLIFQNQARIETKIDILLGKDIAKPSNSPADFLMKSLVPSDENNGHTFPQERVPTKAYLEEQAKQKTDSNQRVDLKILTTFGLYNALKDICPTTQVPDFVTEEYKGELLILIRQPEKNISVSDAVVKLERFMSGQQENGFSSRYRILPSDAKIIVSYEGKRIRLDRLSDYINYKQKFTSTTESENEQPRSFADLFIFDFNSRDSVPLMREQKEKVEEKPGETTVNKLIDLLQSENPHKRMLNLRPILTTDSRVFLVPDFMNLGKSITRLEFSARLLDLISILKTTKGDFVAKEYLFRPVFIHDPAAHTAGPVFIPLTSTESLFFKS